MDDSFWVYLQKTEGANNNNDNNNSKHKNNSSQIKINMQTLHNKFDNLSTSRNEGNTFTIDNICDTVQELVNTMKTMAEIENKNEQQENRGESIKRSLSTRSSLRNRNSRSNNNNNNLTPKTRSPRLNSKNGNVSKPGKGGEGSVSAGNLKQGLREWIVAVKDHH